VIAVLRSNGVKLSATLLYGAVLRTKSVLRPEHLFSTEDENTKKKQH